MYNSMYELRPIFAHPQTCFVLEWRRYFMTGWLETAVAIVGFDVFYGKLRHPCWLS